MIGWSPKPSEIRNSLDVNIKVSAASPWNRLSPDYQHGQIPVPGISGMYSSCVTGIMEGLKLVGPRGHPGKINPGYFAGPSRPRKILPEEWFTGYSLEGVRIDLGEARRKILIPSYCWVLWNRCHDLVANLRTIEKQRDVWIHDGLENCQLDDPEDFSAAFLLVSFLRGDLHLDIPLVLH